MIMPNISVVFNMNICISTLKYENKLLWVELYNKDFFIGWVKELKADKRDN